MNKTNIASPACLLGLAALAFAGGCSHSGISSFSPSFEQSSRPRASFAHSASSQRERAIIVLRIPASRTAPELSNAQSLDIAVQSVTASPWPAPLAEQRRPVATPSPCVGSPQRGYTCSFKLQAVLGTDIFTIKAFGDRRVHSSTPLATLHSGFVTIGSPSKALHFSLDGEIARVALAVPSPESSHNPTTEAIAIARPTSFPLTITPQDASGASVLSARFSSSIKLRIGRRAGLKFHLSIPCPENRGVTTGTRIDLACASELTRVSVEYDGTLTVAGRGRVVDRVSLSALSQPMVSPSPVTVAFTSSVRSSTSLVSIPLSQTQLGFGLQQLALGPDNLMYFTVRGGGGTTLGEFDPTNPSSIQTSSIDWSNSLLVDSYDHIWLTSANGLQCYQSLAAGPTSIATEDGTGAAVESIGVATDNAGNIWWTAFGPSPANTTMQIGSFADAPQCNQLATTSMARFQTGSSAPPPQSIAGIASSSGEPGVWLAMGTAAANGYLQRVYLNSGLDVTVPLPNSAGSIVSDAASNLYVLGYGGPTYQTPQVSTIQSGSQTMSMYPSPLPNFGAGTYLAEYSASGQTATELAEGGAGVNLLDLTSANPAWLSIPAPNATNCQGVAFDASGFPWVACQVFATGNTSYNNIIVYSPVITSTWALAPDAYAISATPTSQTLAIMESGIDSSPFSATSSNPYVLAVGTPTTQYTHQIPVTINSVGTATVTVTDANGRSASIDITVSANQNYPQGATSSPARPNGHKAPRQF
jgi:hypothetical protein